MDCMAVNYNKKQILDPKGIVSHYNSGIDNIRQKVALARKHNQNATGLACTLEGTLVKDLSELIVGLAWQQLGGAPSILAFNIVKTYKIGIEPGYAQKLANETDSASKDDILGFEYEAQVDTFVFIDGSLVMGIGCKPYCDNEMLKEIIAEFLLMISHNPGLICCLLQLESQLGSPYSKPDYEKNPVLGSPSTLTLMSHFPDVDLNIMTLLDGERVVEQPIHEKEHLKEMRLERLLQVIDRFKKLLEPFAKEQSK